MVVDSLKARAEPSNVAPPGERQRWRLIPTRIRQIRAGLIAMAQEAGEQIGLASDQLAVSGNKVQLPQWLFIFLLGQLGAGIWWAATLQSDVRYLQAENGKLWQKVEVLDLQREKMAEQIDAKVKAQVKVQLMEEGYLLLRSKGDP